MSIQWWTNIKEWIRIVIFKCRFLKTYLSELILPFFLLLLLFLFQKKKIECDSGKNRDNEKKKRFLLIVYCQRHRFSVFFFFFLAYFFLKSLFFLWKLRNYKITTINFAISYQKNDSQKYSRASWGKFTDFKLSKRFSSKCY